MPLKLLLMHLKPWCRLLWILSPGLKQVRQAFQIFDFAVQKTNELTGNLEDNKSAAEQLKTRYCRKLKRLKNVADKTKEIVEPLKPTPLAKQVS